jgi:hypothetical protein
MVNLALTACVPNFFGSERTSTHTQIPLELQDRSWLTGDPCAPPCWYGLEVDGSREEEVIAVFEALPFVDPTSIETYVIGFSDPLTGDHYTATRIKISVIGNSTISATVGRGVLKRILFGLNYQITIGEIVDQIGLPDVIRVIPDSNEEFCDASIYWLDKQLVVSYKISGPNWREEYKAIYDGSRVERDILISFVAIIDSSWIEAMMERGEAVPWPGFSD